MDAKQQIANMVKKLTEYHWSPMHPSKYVINDDGKLKGIGVIASRDYGAFNLAWGSCKGSWKTKEDQHNLVVTFSHFQAFTSSTINGEPIKDWACLLQPGGFYRLVQANNTLSTKLKTDLLAAADGAMHVHHV